MLALQLSLSDNLSMALIKDMSEQDIEALTEKEAVMCSSCHMEDSSRILLFDWCGRGHARGLCEDCEKELAKEIQDLCSGKMRLQ